MKHFLNKSWPLKYSAQILARWGLVGAIGPRKSWVGGLNRVEFKANLALMGRLVIKQIKFLKGEGRLSFQSKGNKNLKQYF